MDPQDFGFLDPDPQKYADPRIRIQGAKYQPKTANKNTLSQTPNLNVGKQRLLKISSSLEWFIKLQHKKNEKKDLT